MWFVIFFLFFRALKQKNQREAKQLEKHKLITSLLFSIEELIEKKYDFGTLIAEISRMLVNEGKYDVVWFARYDEQRNAIIPFNSFGDRRIYLNDVVHKCSDKLYKSPACQTYKTNQTTLINDITHSKYKKFYAQSAQSSVFHSHASFITHSSENDTIVMVIEGIHKNQFNPYDTVLFEHIAQLIHKAYLTIQKAKQHDIILQHSLEAGVVFEIDEALLVADENMNFIQVNDTLCNLVGYTKEELIGAQPSLIHQDIEDTNFFTSLINTLHESRYWHGTMHLRTKDDQILEEDVTIYAVIKYGKITNFVTRYRTIQNTLSQDNITFKAYHDALTKLPNRSLLLDRLKLAFSSNKRNKKIGGLLFIDMDNFKNINDSYGHDAGDFLLLEVSKRLKEVVREEDTVARLGGDEFVVLLNELSSEKNESASHATIVAKNILTTLAKPYMFNSIALHSTPSIGIALFPEMAQNYEDVIKQGDISMYKAKSQGKNSIYFYDEQLDNQIQKNRALETDLRQALLSNEFSLYYQPKIDIYHRGITGTEALIRWVHPIEGEILPSRFLHIIEKSNLKNSISEWIIKQACEQIKIWQDSHLIDEDFSVGINISTTQFNQNDFVEKLLKTIQRYDVNPKNIEIELVEEAMQINYNKVAQKMDELREYGINFSVDDFGSGHSSLVHLKEMSINQLIISRDFISDIHTNEQSKVITKTIISMAHSLGIEVTAKGVENKSQLTILQNLKCDNYQGYYFSKALKPRDFEKLYTEQKKHF